MLAVLLGMSSAQAQEKMVRDPAEGPQAKAQAKVPARPAGAVARQSIDEKSMRALIHNLVSCGTRLTLSSWTDPKRGVGCGRDFVVARLNEIADAIHFRSCWLSPCHVVISQQLLPAEAELSRRATTRE